MTNPAVWSYGLAAVAFAAFTLQLALGARSGGVRAFVLIGIVAGSALWAATTLAFELFGGAWTWFAAKVFDVARIGGWLGFVLLLGVPVGAGTITGRDARTMAPAWVSVLAGALLLANLALPAPAAVPLAGGDDALLFAAGLGLAILGLVLVEQLYRRTPEQVRWGIKPLVLGLGGMLAFDLFLFSEAMLFRRIDPDIWAARGLAHALVIPFAAVATARNTAWTIDLHVSRGVVLHSTALLVSGVYLLALAAAGYYVRFFGGTWGKMLQVALVFAALLLLALVVFSGQFRSRLRVFVSKHFFSYRFDYREQWLRFTQTLSPQGQDLGLQQRQRLREHEALAELELGTGRPGHPRRGAQDRRWLAHEDRLAGGSRRPVDGVLEHAGHAVVVLRRRNQQRVGVADGPFEGRHWLRGALRLEVGVVERDRGEVEDPDRHAFRGQLLRRPQKGAVEGAGPQAPGDAEDRQRAG